MKHELGDPALAGITTSDMVGSSDLLLIECQRVLQRERMEAHLGALDAIHLASAILWEEAEQNSDLSVLTYDKRLALCARALGVRVTV